MWALLVLLAWVLLEVMMERLAGESGPEIHSITAPEASTAGPEDHNHQRSAVDG